MTRSSLREQFAAIVGDANAISDPVSLRAAETATFDVRHEIPLIVRPASRPEVQECVRLANRLRTPLYPVSRGRNWGYGSRVPSASGCILLELSRMNRIVDFSAEHAYITVEPGVTQGQVVEFLAERRARLILDCTGASPDCSVIGNTVERGFGHTPYGDHFAHICNLEVVLPDGDCIETGFGRFGNVAATPVYRWGVGPILDGLFSQSNLGIVTRMTAFLMPEPEYFQAFFFSCEREQDLGPVIDALRPLRLDGTLRSASHIGNHYKVVSGIEQYPWDKTGGQTPLTGQVMEALCREFDIGAWSGSGALYGTRAQVAEARRLLRRALRRKVSRLRFLDDRALAFAERFATPAKWLAGWDMRRIIELVRPVIGLMRGRPTEYALRSVYWRKRTPIPADMDPDRDGCGLLWCAPVAPIAGSHATRIAQLASETLLASGFEPMLSITLITERALTCVISISYDRDVPGEDERAMTCHYKLLSALRDNGYHFYRLGIQSMRCGEHDDTYAELFQRLKLVFDPNAILAPGRYDPRGNRLPVSVITK
ncbi:MAG TPA: FAD-binding oxidoreductase [Bryobacteraceae bacterium]|nr:FAD-binding oxidoreductase [Bryobacteraceae bacterium]